MIWIAGHPKAGTSALYFFLRSHPEVDGLVDKEVCPSPGEAPEAFLQRSTPRTLHANQVLMNGCLQEQSPLLRELAREFGTLVVYLWREKSDWVYASWQFWCHPSFDFNCTAYGKWANTKQHHRSPQLFHELVLAEAKVLNNLVWQLSAENYTARWLDLKGRYGERLLSLATEDLFEKRNDVLRKVLLAAGLRHHLKWLPNIPNVAINVNSNKGVGNVAMREDALGASYEPMLPATRAILRRRFYGECMFMVKNAGMPWDCEGSDDEAGIAPPPPPSPPPSPTADTDLEDSGWHWIGIHLGWMLFLALVLTFRRCPGRTRR